MGTSELAREPYSIGFTQIRVYWFWLFQCDPDGVMQTLHLALLQAGSSPTKNGVVSEVGSAMYSLARELGFKRQIGKGWRREEDYLRSLMPAGHDKDVADWGDLKLAIRPDRPPTGRKIGRPRKPTGRPC